MELNINLLTQERSKTRTVFGILMILSSLSWIVIILSQEEKIKVFDWFYFAAFLALGIAHLIEGTGIPLTEIFGAKAYIQINRDRICIKHNAFQKEKRINWNEIKDIEYKSAQYQITKTDNSKLIMELPTDNYNQVQTIKETVKTFAAEKGIQMQ